MSRCLELFIRMHLAKTPTDERGRQVLTGDVIVAVLGTLQRDHRIGCDLIMAKWLDDTEALWRVEGYLDDWLASKKGYRRPELCRHIVRLAAQVFYGKPTAAQTRHLTALWRRHSEQGRRSKRLIRRWQTKVAMLARGFALDESEFRSKQDDREIARLHALIAGERERIATYAREQAARTCVCPRCCGTGRVNAVHTCEACNGSGEFVPTADNVRQHLRHLGIARVSDRLWHSELKPVFDDALHWLHAEHGEAVKALDRRLERESAA